MGHVELKGFVFPLEITDIDERFIELPKVKLTKIPAGLLSSLPHIGRDGILCYLDREGVVLDRYRPEQMIRFIIGRVKALLQSYTEPENLPKEFADEFIAYWGGTSWCYLLTKERPALARAFKRKTLSGDEQSEIVIGANDEELNDWVQKRNAAQKDRGTVPAVIVDIKKRPLVPLTGEWPPKTLQAFHDWLMQLDPGAAQSLIHQLSQVANRNTDVPIVALTPDSIFGLLVRYDPLFRLEYRSGKQKSRRKGAGNRIKSLVLSNRGIKEFNRLNVSDATIAHITQRPLEKNTLKDRKIAQIGCGAIGGYSAVMLVQAGAGQGRGKLDLYDGELFSSDNMGRHILGVEYLDEQKSVALKDYIDHHCSTNRLTVGAFSDWDLDEHKFNDYDLIIDATGDQMLSTSLAHELHRMNHRPTIIHGWIDAGGLAARALTDDGQKACYRCLSLESGTGFHERFKMYADEDLHKVPKVRRRCGFSYQPYASNAPSAAAGLIQSLALDYCNGDPSPRFRHLSLSKIIRHVKFGDPDRLENCPCCQKI